MKYKLVYFGTEHMKKELVMKFLGLSLRKGVGNDELIVDHRIIFSCAILHEMHESEKLMMDT